MVGAVNPDSFDTLHSYSNTFEMPFLTPWFPEKVCSPRSILDVLISCVLMNSAQNSVELGCAYNFLQIVSSFMDFATSMRPDFHRAVIDTIAHYGWKNIIYLYNTLEGKQLLARFVDGVGGETFPAKTSIVLSLQHSLNIWFHL